MNHLKQSNSQRQKVEQGLGEEVMGNCYHRISGWDDEKVLKMDSSNGCTTM